ncbi:MAG: FKBP-type peptidyl-prolyl cis-trans isomerase [Nitrosopumilus sp.]|nr:FKBP-type peptidyl-prolyl cis-trans isomerase [Nitrosopumilus sp.]
MKFHSHTTKVLFFKILTVIFIITSCDNNDDFKTTSSGLKYKIHRQSDGSKAQVGELLDLELVCTDEKDSVVFDSRKVKSTIKLNLSEPTFVGGMEEGFAMLSEGDSATFIIPADSFYEKTSLEPLPESIRRGSMLTFNVRVEKIQTRDEYEKNLKSDNERRKANEETELKNYFEKNNLVMKPTNTGLFFISKNTGNGKAASAGKTVSVHYRGKFLDGKEFDSSFERGEPLEFPLGEGRVIPGWEEGISMMKEGGKATLVIPSHLAYGERGYGSLIPSYTPLVFDVELISVK